MRIVHLSNTDSGGAIELHAAMLEQGIDSKMLVAMHDLSYTPYVYKVSRRYKIKSIISNIISKWIIGSVNSNHGLFSLPIWSGRISKNEFVVEADIIYLHFVAHSSFISLKELNRILRLAKPVIFVTRDMWPITGGCHTFLDCERFKDTCENCPCLIKTPRLFDLARLQQKIKRDIYLPFKNIHFVAISSWNTEMLLQSKVLKNKSVVTINNCIDTYTFGYYDRKIARLALGLPVNKVLVGFGARDISNPGKGFSYVKQALSLVMETSQIDIAIVTFGKPNSVKFNIKGVDQYDLGFISGRDTLSTYYNSIDLFLNPSLFENFGNTAAEALACGTPVVAFKTGGLMDIVDHKRTGYLATLRDVDDLACGIIEFIHRANINEVREECSLQARVRFARSVIAEKHLSLIRSILNGR